VVVSLVLAAVCLLVPYFFGPPDGPGVFGDMFGVANALFSGLAFVGIIIAILLQRQELSLQRLELEATREEMALARQESARSAHAAELAARLSALSQLIAYNKGQAEKFAGWAFEETPDANAPGGVRERVVDEHSEKQYRLHREAYERFLGELTEVYSALVRATHKPAA
jgi:hypothetical protein